MESLQFKRLVLVSDTTKSANQFRFDKRFNLITGTDNSIGKSTLVKNLFWALGCEPEFDDNWKPLDCKAMLEFSISGKSYVVIRVNNTIAFGNEGDGYTKYFSITGEYSETLSKVVRFNAKLPSRADEPVLETPPPAYYFLPFYIDQLRSWVCPWNSFLNLGQYSSWKPTIVKYHTGYLSPEHFDIEGDLFEYRDQKKAADEEVKLINSALSIVEKYVPQTPSTVSPEEFEELAKEVEVELANLASKQEVVLSELSALQSSRYHLSSQLEIAIRSVDEIEADYKFAVEYIEGDEIECPLCGSIHDNSMVSRANILTDKQQAEEQVISIENDLREIEQKLSEQKANLEEIRTSIREINEKYRARNGGEEGEGLNLNSIIDGFASRSVQRNVEESRAAQESRSKNISDKQKELKKDQKKLLTKERREELSAMFLGIMSEFLLKLNAKGVNLSNVKHPSDYNKIFGSGGAAEGTRAALAYQMAVFRQIYYVGNEIPAPLVVDTPNQQEQANQHYEKIIDLLMNDSPAGSQIIVCGMNNPHIKPFADMANVIQLNEDKLLNKSNYEELSAELTEIFGSAISNYNKAG